MDLNSSLGPKLDPNLNSDFEHELEHSSPFFFSYDSYAKLLSMPIIAWWGGMMDPSLNLVPFFFCDSCVELFSTPKVAQGWEGGR